MIAPRIVVLAILLTSLEIDGQFSCSQKIDGCICSTSQNGGSEINCPDMEEPSVSVSTKSESVHVVCTNVTDFDVVPKLRVGDVKAVRIENCFLPGGFDDVMRRLGLRGIRDVKFDMCADPTQCQREKLGNWVVTNRYMRGMEFLVELHMPRNLIGQIERDAFKDTPDLEIIDFCINNLENVPTFFDFTPKVRAIDLSRNQITHLPEGVFNKTPKLRVLHLFENRLRVLDERIFVNVRNLTLLELSSNDLVTLPENLLRPLINLTQVNFSSNNLTKLPEKLFQNNLLLQNVRLSRNAIEELPELLFANLRKLEELELSGNKLETVSDRLFRDLINLQTLNMEHNLLTFPTTSFTNLGNLVKLDLSRNKIVNLHKDFFGGLGKLKKLFLGFNRLTAIVNQLPLENLEELHLQNNNINNVDFNAFYFLRKLQTLNLSNNKLSALNNIAGNTAFNYLVELEYLNLRNNSLSIFYQDFKISWRIRRIDLSYNNISSITLFDVKTTSTETKINLAHNQIKTVDFAYLESLSRELSQDDSITAVELSGNPIACDCHSYQLSKYFHKSIDTSILHRFKLEDAELNCASPPSLSGSRFSSLNPRDLTCEVSESCPKHCECQKRPADDTLSIDCSYRNFTRAPVLKPTLPRMNYTAVYLDGNYLTEFTEEVSGYDRVTGLYLQNNELSNITWIPPKINILELQDNNLTRLGYDVLSSLNDSTTLTSLSLHNNPWICDCSPSTLNFTVALRENLIRKIAVENLTCDDNNLNLLYMTTDDICEANTVLIIGLGASLFTMLILLAFAMALYYKYNQEIKIWLFSHNMLLWFVSEEDLDKDKEYDAFLSYSHADEEFVVNHLVPELEGGPNPYKLCIHIRDFIAGEFISTQITHSVESSRRTIIVLSPNFSQSTWSKMEFRTAHAKAMDEGRARVIVILYGDIDINADIDEELKSYLKTNTYVKWGDPWFWQKLKYALPHIRNLPKKGKKKMDNINLTIDKMDLINSSSTPNTGTPPAVSLDPLLLKGGNPLMFKPDKNMGMTPPAESGLLIS